MNRTTNADWYTMRLKEAEADLVKIGAPDKPCGVLCRC